MVKKISLIILLVIIPFSLIARAEHSELNAAFIRNDDLWLKKNKSEIQLTYREYIRHPKWSHDGEWIAYIKGRNQGGNFRFSSDLWIYNVKMDKHFKVKENVKNNFQWAPRKNKMGFLVNKDLYILNTEPSSHFHVTQITNNIENFAWIPDENGLLTSVKENKQLNSDIILTKILLRSDQQKPVFNHFYTIDIKENELFISTSQFKWSNDKKWLSFLLNPTASMSADSNTLCLLSQDGQIFQRINEMLDDGEWFQWSPSKGVLGYICGSGREALKNKQLTTVNVPTFHKEILTPKGYVDRDLTWKNNHILYVSRSKESEFIKVTERPMPRIFELASKQKQVTFPQKNEGDFRPQFYFNHLFWIRTDRKSANIFVSPVHNMKEKQWIKNITLPSWYYEKWDWEEVFSLYRG